MFRSAFRSIGRTAIQSIVGTAIALGTVEVVTQLPSKGRKSEWYHSMVDEWCTPLMRQVLNPEDAHHMAIELCRRGWSPLHRPSIVEQRLNMTSAPFVVRKKQQQLQPTEINDQTMDDEKSKTNDKQEQSDKDDDVEEDCHDGIQRLQFQNPIGLAAGFDKDGIIIRSLFELGFGFVEIGSVTLNPQPGNPKPRMFRYPNEHAIINRYGFNSLGVDYVEQQLVNYYRRFLPFKEQERLYDERQQQQPQKDSSEEKPKKRGRRRKKKFRQLERDSGVIGINLGKNKTSTTPIEDYKQLIYQLGPYADYLVINVSSPNTPGLRDLQEKESLLQLLTACIEARDQLEDASSTSLLSTTPPRHSELPPLLVKLAPDLTNEELQEIASVLLEVQIDGIILTNTTNQRPTSFLSVGDGGTTTSSLSSSSNKNETGGLSGRPLRDISTERIRTMYQLTNGTIPIIGVGGITTAYDVYDKLKAGASLVEVYTSLVYEGPGLVSRLRHDLAKLFIEHGHRNIDDVIGLDHPDIHWRKQQERAKHHQQ